MLYSTGSFHVLGAVLTRITGKSLLRLAREWLGEPLDILFPPWTRDPQGYYLGGNNMLLSPLDLLRFGETWRTGGIGGEGSVLSKDWMAASWTPRTVSPFSGDAYGYGWFLTTLGDHAAAYARGYGGQMLYVVPALELTVVVTSHHLDSSMRMADRIVFLTGGGARAGTPEELLASDEPEIVEFLAAEGRANGARSAGRAS